MLPTRKGFTSGQLVVAIYICLLMLPLILGVTERLITLPLHYHEISGNIALTQLRKIFLMAYDIEVNQDEVRFIYGGQNFRLYSVNRHLIMSPGTQIIYEDIDDLRFYYKNGALYLEILKRGKYEEFCLASKESFSLAPFLDGDSSDDEFS